MPTTYVNELGVIIDKKEIIIKKLQNRRDKNKKSKAQRLFELYGQELRKLRSFRRIFLNGALMPKEA